MFWFEFIATLSDLALGQWEVLVGRQARVLCRGYPAGLALEELAEGLWMWEMPLEGQLASDKLTGWTYCEAGDSRHAAWGW